MKRQEEVFLNSVITINNSLKYKWVQNIRIKSYQISSFLRGFAAVNKKL